MTPNLRRARKLASGIKGLTVKPLIDAARTGDAKHSKENSHE